MGSQLSITRLRLWKTKLCHVVLSIFLHCGLKNVWLFFRTTSVKKMHKTEYWLRKRNPQFSHHLNILNQDLKILVKLVASLPIFKVQFLAWYILWGRRIGQKLDLQGNEDLLDSRYSSIGDQFCSKFDVVDTVLAWM